MAGLSIDLRYPAGAFVYGMTKPRVTVDGHEVPVHDWGQNYFDVVVGGPHRIEIYVPYALPRRAGRARLDVMVPEQGVALEYMAPSFTFARGSLGAPGQQVSVGHKTTVTVVAMIPALAIFGVALYGLYLRAEQWWG
ncbi:hypothetical protein [Actinoplanes regularis]|uniref:Uncharacterized protein n=1 Tax=Actinoplanes regularis TaxID=52697 RepID=A0A239K8G6_9ACTN|nr:hypothetical protein [Actinoplanes regularis]GIE92427.1 hypothetical protein Are01nite_89070 [Actinoplanes regularis]SNT13444.1 hypothetical protein SAMN06264365_14313 [Actinoplanes regularis]